MYVVVDFICMGLLERELQNEKNAHFWIRIRLTSVYEANSLTIALLDLIYIEHLKIDHVLPELAI